MPDITLEQAMQLALDAHSRRDPARAETLCREVLQQRPDQPDAVHLLGLIAFDSGHADAGIRLLARSVALAPQMGPYHENLIKALIRSGRRDEALQAARDAVALHPTRVELIAALADLLLAADQWDEAETHLRTLIRLGAVSAEVHSNLAHVLRRKERLEEAADECRRALAIRPDCAEAIANLGTIQMESGQVSHAIESYRAALHIKPQFPLVHSDLLYALHFDSANEPAAIFQEHLGWAARYATPLAGEIRSHPHRKRRERLRIGYVSGDFRAHPVGYFLFSLLSQHDHARFETHAFSDVKQPDPATARFRSLIDQWHHVAGMSDAQLAQCIREREIDILVDLGGHVGAVRLLAFARKPAPVQVTWLGYPDTTGLATIDYRLTDGYADPVGLTERYHTEQLVRLPKGFLCFPDLLNLDAAPPGPRDPAAPVTFGSFNQVAKMSPQTIALWARILKEAGGDARMLIKTQRAGDEQNRQRLRSAFAEHGINEHRLDLLPRESNYLDHIRRYAHMDVALDTFPYHGTTTTCEALAMGVPVVTLAGPTHVSRVGVSLLTHLGQPDWIATNEDDYVRIALELASDRPRLAALRQEFRPRLLASPLCDAARFARDVEAAFDAMWQHWEEDGGEAD